MLFFCFQKSFSFDDNPIQFDFVEQDISDIIYALSLYAEYSIVCDDTVFGNSSFRYSGKDFEKAFSSFLLSNRLYDMHIDGIRIVTKVCIQKGENNTFSIDCSDSFPDLIFEKLSIFSGIPISFAQLPRIPLSLHVKNASVLDIVFIALPTKDEWNIVKTENGISIKESKNEKWYDEEPLYLSESVIIQKNENGLFSLEIKESLFSSIIEKLFSITHDDFCNFVSKNVSIARISCKNYTKDEVLWLICSASNVEFYKDDGTFIFFSSDNTSSQTVLETKELFWKKVGLRFMRTAEFIRILKERFPFLNPIIVSPSSFIVSINVRDSIALDALIDSCDIPPLTKIITLQFIDSHNFLAHLPPGMNESQFVETGSGHTLFFTGTQEEYLRLDELIHLIDVPVDRISYDLLIIQAQKGETSEWDSDSSLQPLEAGNSTNLIANLGQSLGLQFDIISTLGYSFASKLHCAIKEHKAQIYVDTQLHGVSGSSICFSNTNTYRYKDTAIDPETGKPLYNGITREIISGLVLDVCGTVSGDGMVTTKVTASVSHRGEVSNSTGNPPLTSEKNLTTEVRSRSGEPVILGGLIQNDELFSTSGVPGLSNIPIIGLLFKSHSSNSEMTEMTIYLIPHVKRCNSFGFDTNMEVVYE